MKWNEPLLMTDRRKSLFFMNFSWRAPFKCSILIVVLWFMSKNESEAYQKIQNKQRWLVLLDSLQGLET